jgi:hypothetical protein
MEDLEQIEGNIDNDALSKLYSQKFSDFKEDAVSSKEVKSIESQKAAQQPEQEGSKKEKEIDAADDSQAKAEKKENIKKVNNEPDVKELEARINEAKKWGQVKNRALLNTKKKVTAFLSKLQEDGVLPEDEAKNVIESFDIIDDTEDAENGENKTSVNPFVAVKEKLDNEFKMFKRYNRDSNLEKKYQAFYSFFPMMTGKEQEESFNYLNESEPDVALDYIMTNGSEIYNSVMKGAEEKGGVLKYINSLHKKLEKLEKKSSELEQELDTTTKSLYNSGTDSTKAKSFGTKASTIEELYAAKFRD